MFTEEQLEYLDGISIKSMDVDISVRAENCITAQIGPDASVGDVARMTEADRMRIPNYGRKCEQEVVGAIDYLLRCGVGAVASAGTDTPKKGSAERLHDLAFPLFQQFVTDVTYANLTYTDIARRAFAAAREYNTVRNARGRKL
jgi:hypothetical protein